MTRQLEMTGAPVEKKTEASGSTLMAGVIPVGTPIQLPTPSTTTSAPVPAQTTFTVHKPEARKFRTFTIYGPTGAGKSWFGVSAESSLGGRTLVISTEDAESGLTGFDVDIVTVHSMGGFRAVLRALKDNPGKYSVLVVDSMSQLQKFGLAADAEDQYEQKNTKTPLNIPLDSYKRIGEDVRRSIWFARTLPLHIILICLDRVFVSEDQTVRMIGPNLTEALSADVRAYSDVVGYMTADMLDVEVKGTGERRKQLVRRLFLSPQKDFHARVRAGRGITVPEVIVAPTLQKVLSIFTPKEETTK